MFPIPIFFPGEDRTFLARDKVLKFPSWADAETRVETSLVKLFGGPVEFSLKGRWVSFTDNAGKGKTKYMDYDWLVFKGFVYFRFEVLDSDGRARLLETALVEDLLSGGDTISLQQ